MNAIEVLEHIRKMCEVKRKVFSPPITRTDDYEDGYGDGVRGFAGEILEVLKVVDTLTPDATIPKVSTTVLGVGSILVRVATPDADEWVRQVSPSFGELMYNGKEGEYVLQLKLGENLNAAVQTLKMMGTY